MLNSPLGVLIFLVNFILLRSHGNKFTPEFTLRIHSRIHFRIHYGIHSRIHRSITHEGPAASKTGLQVQRPPINIWHRTRWRLPGHDAASPGEGQAEGAGRRSTSRKAWRHHRHASGSPQDISRHMEKML